MREEYAADGPDVVLSRALRDGASSERLERREQALVLLNRRGFATAVFCRQCGGTLECPNCSVSLIVHGEGAARRARCHYCNYSARVPTHVPHVRGAVPRADGLRHRARRGRSRRGCSRARASRAWIATRSGARARSPRCCRGSRDGEIDVLVGTQMIAKGHDFPRVTLVGVISADVGLGLADFRAGRADVSAADAGGRPRRPRRAAGRGDRPDALSRALQHPARVPRRTTARSYERELRVPRRRCAIRPLVALINVVVRARTFAGAMDDAARSRAAAAAGGRRARGCACSARRRRRSAGCAANTARSSSSRGRTAGDARGAARGARRAARAARGASWSTSIR